MSADNLADFREMFTVQAQPMFVSQQSFRLAVRAAEARGLDPGAYLPPRTLAHPSVVAWFHERVALGRMREHFGLSDG
jgi:hypothetical protein